MNPRTQYFSQLVASGVSATQARAAASARFGRPVRRPAAAPPAPAPRPPTPAQAARAQAWAEGAQAERSRAAAVVQACRLARCPERAPELIAEGLTGQQARETLLAEARAATFSGQIEALHGPRQPQGTRIIQGRGRDAVEAALGPEPA